MPRGRGGARRLVSGEASTWTAHVRTPLHSRTYGRHCTHGRTDATALMDVRTWTLHTCCTHGRDIYRRCTYGRCTASSYILRALHILTLHCEFLHFTGVAHTDAAPRPCHRLPVSSQPRVGRWRRRGRLPSLASARQWRLLQSMWAAMRTTQSASTDLTRSRPISSDLAADDHPRKRGPPQPAGGN